MTVKSEKKHTGTLQKQNGPPQVIGCSRFITKERTRYERKGYGLVNAAIIALSFFWGISHYGKLYWPSVMEFIERHQITYTQLFLGWHSMQHLLINVVGNLVLWIFYHFEFEFIERYKTNNNPWPWYSDPEGWQSLMRKSIALNLFNILILPMIVFLPTSYFGVIKQHSLDVSEIPSPPILALTIFFCMLCEDFTFHMSHRFLHWKPIYPYIHKLHHTHNTTIGIAAEYAHPIEYILGNIGPTSVGPLLLGPHMHLVTLFAWYAVRSAETLDGHCGYEFSWSPYRLIPFSGSAEYHDFHHSANIGNFSSFFSIWDTVFGTNKAYWSFVAEREEEKKAHQAQKNAKKVQ